MKPIDFVVTWVDGSDQDWLSKKRVYSGNELKGMNSLTGFRDWGTLKYWFRGVEKFAPWVNKVYLVTANQKPDWINLNNPKLVLVSHDDYMPKAALPVFNSNAIEALLYKIPNLSEQFVYFNDDMFLINPTSSSDFFYKDKPKDIAVFYPIKQQKNGTAHFQVNNMDIINKYFSKKDILKNSTVLSRKYGLDNLRTLSQLICKFIPGFFETHMPNSFLKSTFEEVWTREYDILLKTVYSKFRSDTNTNQWLFRDWQLAGGNFSPRNNRKFGKYMDLTDNNEKVWEIMQRSKYKVLCINDVSVLNDPESVRKELINSFETILPTKSSFEI